MVPQSLQMSVSSSALVCKVVRMRFVYQECLPKIMSTMLCHALIVLCLSLQPPALGRAGSVPIHGRKAT